MRKIIFITLCIILSIINISSAGTQRLEVSQKFNDINRIYKIVVTADGKYMISQSGNFSYIVRVRNIKTGKLLHLFKSPRVAISFDGALVALRKGNNNVEIYNTITGKLLKNLSASTEKVRNLYFSNNNDLLVVEGVKKLIIYFTNKEYKKHELPKYKKVLYDIQISPNSQIIACTYWNTHAITLYDLKNEQTATVLKYKASINNRVQFGADDNTLVSGGPGGLLLFWKINKLKIVSKKQAHNLLVNYILFNSQKSYCVSTGGRIDPSLIIWDPGTYKKIKKTTFHADPIQGIVYNKNSTILATGDEGGKVVLTSLKNYKKICQVNLENIVTNLTYHPDGRLIVGDNKGNIIFYKLRE